MSTYEPTLLPVPFEDAPIKRLRLVHATVVIRHGLRTPLQKLSEVPWDCSASRVMHAVDNGGGVPKALFLLRPILFQSDLAGSCSPGQLTRMGFQQHVSLGAMLRERYVERRGLLPVVLAPETLYVRSSQYDRTIASAQGLLSGLYPARDRTITINVRHPSHENLYPREDSSCPAVLEMYKRLTEPFKLYFQKYQAQELITTLETLTLHHHPLPDNSPSLGEIFRQSAHDHATLFGNRQFSSLSIGNFLGELWGGIVQPSVKFRLYSAHDTTLLPLLGCISQIDPEVGIPHPPCGSSLVFELYEEENDREKRHVAVWYNSKPLHLRDLKCSVSPGYYSLSHVAALLEPMMLSEERYKELCQKT